MDNAEQWTYVKIAGEIASRKCCVCGETVLDNEKIVVVLDGTIPDGDDDYFSKVCHSKCQDRLADNLEDEGKKDVQ